MGGKIEVGKGEDNKVAEETYWCPVCGMKGRKEGHPECESRRGRLDARLESGGGQLVSLFTEINQLNVWAAWRADRLWEQIAFCPNCGGIGRTDRSFHSSDVECARCRESQLLADAGWDYVSPSRQRIYPATGFGTRQAISKPNLYMLVGRGNEYDPANVDIYFRHVLPRQHWRKSTWGHPQALAAITFLQQHLHYSLGAIENGTVRMPGRKEPAPLFLALPGLTIPGRRAAINVMAQAYKLRRGKQIWLFPNWPILSAEEQQELESAKVLVELL